MISQFFELSVQTGSDSMLIEGFARVEEALISSADRGGH